MSQGDGHIGAETLVMGMRGCTPIWHDAPLREAIESLLLQGATFDETSAYIREHCPHLGQPSADTIRDYIAFKMKWMQHLLLRNENQFSEDANQAESNVADLKNTVSSATFSENEP